MDWKDKMDYTETQLKSKLTKALRESLNNAVIFRHEDQFTSGVPDISITWKGYTTWLEVKLAKPAIRGKGVQKHTMQMLAENGRCWYVVYTIKKLEGHLINTKSIMFPGLLEPQFYSTFIVSPKEVNDGNWILSKNYVDNFDHQFVVDFIKNSHSHG